MGHEIIRELEKIQDQVKQELQNVKTYRAFLAVDKAIEEISEIEEIARSLTGIRSQVVDRLNDVREYRALLAVEKSVQDIAEVLGVLEEASRRRIEATNKPGVTPVPASQPADETSNSSADQAGEAQTGDIAAPTEIVVDRPHRFGAPPTPRHVEMTAADAAREGDAITPSVIDPAANLPLLSTVVMADQTREPQPHPELTSETAGHGAHVVHEPDATSRSEVDTFGHTTIPPTILMAGQDQQQEQSPEPAGESAENDANSMVHQGDAPESEDIGIAKVA